MLPSEHPVAVMEFFDRELPERIRANLAVFRAHRGAISFCVRGVGEWTLSFGEPEGAIERRFDWNAPLCLWFSPAAFAHLREGGTDWERFQADGAIAATGDLRLLDTFADVVGAPESLLSLRSRGPR